MQHDVKTAANKYVAFVEDHFKGKKILAFVEDHSKGKKTPVLVEEKKAEHPLNNINVFDGVSDETFKGASPIVLKFLKDLFNTLAMYSITRIQYANPNAAKGTAAADFISTATSMFEYIFGVKTATPSRDFADYTHTNSFVESLNTVSQIYTNAKEVNDFEATRENVPKIIAQLTPGFRSVLKRLWNTNKDMATELAYSPNLAFKSYQSARTSFKDAVIDLACVLETRTDGFNEKAKKSRSKSGKPRSSKSCSRSKKKARRSASSRRKKQRQRARGGSRLK